MVTDWACNPRAARAIAPERRVKGPREAADCVCHPQTRNSCASGGQPTLNRETKVGSSGVSHSIAIGPVAIPVGWSARRWSPSGNKRT